MGDERASARAHVVSRGQVNDTDLAAEDAGPGNDGPGRVDDGSAPATSPGATGDPGNSKDVNQAGDN